MSFNNFGHLITSTITTLQHFATLNHTSPNYTSLHLSILHFLSLTLHYSTIWLHVSAFLESFFWNTRDKNKIIKTVCDGQSAFFHCYSVSQHCVIITEVTGTLSTGKVKVNLLVSTPWRHARKCLYSSNHRIHRIEGWMGPTVGLNVFGRR